MKHLSLFRKLVFATLAVASLATQALAQSDLGLTRAEFETVALETAQNVDVFRDLWNRDPGARVFGGASRDYLFWLVRKIRQGPRGESLPALRSRLLSEGVISSTEFLRHDSDLDVLSSNGRLPDGAAYGIGKVESIPRDRLNQSTLEGADEVRQGFLPVEKILLARDGLSTPSQFGDGVGEIFDDKPTLRFFTREIFDTTRFAALKLNHPVLLANRWVRAVSMSQFAHRGGDVDLVVTSLDSQSLKHAQEAVASAQKDRDFREALGQPRFYTWMVRGVMSSFTKLTNRRVTKSLFALTGHESLIKSHQLVPYNHLNFNPPAPGGAEALVRRAGFDPSAIQKARVALAGTRLFHGTPSEEGFRTIIRDGFLPSSTGLMGDGLYSVEAQNLKTATNFAGEDPNRVVQFDIDPEARVLDITTTAGRQLFDALDRSIPGATTNDAARADRVAKAYGIDAFVYEFVQGRAIVVKNGASIGEPSGLYRRSLNSRELVERAANVRTNVDYLEFVQNLMSSQAKLNVLVQIADSISHPSDLGARLRDMQASLAATGMSLYQASYIRFALQLEAMEIATVEKSKAQGLFMNEAATELERLISQVRSSSNEDGLMKRFAQDTASVVDRKAALRKAIGALDKRYALKRSEIGVKITYLRDVMKAVGQEMLRDPKLAFVIGMPTYLVLKVAPEALINGGVSPLISYASAAAFMAVILPAIWQIGIIEIGWRRWTDILSVANERRSRMADRQVTTQWTTAVKNETRRTSVTARTCEFAFAK